MSRRLHLQRQEVIGGKARIDRQQPLHAGPPKLVPRALAGLPEGVALAEHPGQIDETLPFGRRAFLRLGGGDQSQDSDRSRRGCEPRTGRQRALTEKRESSFLGMAQSGLSSDAFL